MKKIVLLIGLLMITLSVRAQSYQAAVDRLAGDPALAGAALSFCVLDMQSNELLAMHDARALLKPASSLKILTTATALITLGKDYRFKTELRHSGYIDGMGILHGNLYIKGYGDPTLGSDQWERGPDLEAILEEMTVVVRESGITKVLGSVIADPHWFDGTPVPASWPEKDLGNYYAAGAWGLNIHENLFHLPFQQNSRTGGRPGILPLRPEVPGLQFVNEVQSRGSSDHAYIFKGPYEFVRPVRGTIPAGTGVFTIKGSIPDPPKLFAQLLVRRLSDAGIGVANGAAVAKPDSKVLPPTLLWATYSPPLKEIIKRANQESVNLYCEVLLKAVGKQTFGAGTRQEGVQALKRIWSERGIDLSSIKLDDGSGLSHENRISTYQLAGVMRKAVLDPNIGHAFRVSLAVAGRSGTLEGTLRGTPAEGRIWGKTGSMKGVRSYTGIAQNRQGREVAFSVVVNDYACSSRILKSKLETWMLSLCE